MEKNVRYWLSCDSDILSEHYESPVQLGFKMGTPRLLKPQEEFFLALCLLWQGVAETHLSHLFNVSQATISRIIISWIPRTKWADLFIVCYRSAGTSVADLQTIYRWSTDYLQIICRMSAEYLQNICKMSAEHLQRWSATSLQICRRSADEISLSG